MATNPDDEDDEYRELFSVDRIFETTSAFLNPTDAQDKLNYSLPEELQFPRTSGQIYYYDEPEEVEGAGGPIPDYTLIRCYRDRHPSLPQAQKFFDRQRINLGWRAEGPIYRTARFWVKRVYGVRYGS